MEHLIVENFGPITKLNIDIRKINVFIGEQGVGKSTIAKLLSCCRDLYLYYLIAHEEKDEHIKYIFGIHGIQNYLQENTYIEYRSEGSWHLMFKDGVFSISHDNISDIKDFTSYIIKKGLEDICLKVGKKPYTEFSNDEFKDFINKNFRIASSHLRTSFYCPAERGIVGTLSRSMASFALSEIPLPLTLLEFMSFFEKARNEYNIYSIPFLGLEYKYMNGEDIVKGKDFSIPLHYASSGIQAILPLLMVIDYCLTHKFFCSFTVEEPELNLFPTNQLHLLRTLIKKTNEIKDDDFASWTITTHSPYLLSVLNISLLAGIITKKFPERLSQFHNIIPEEYVILPDQIAVYSLDKHENAYCKNIIDKSTGLIQANYLDGISDLISSEFNKLYKVYINLLRDYRD